MPRLHAYDQELMSPARHVQINDIIETHIMIGMGKED